MTAGTTASRRDLWVRVSLTALVVLAAAGAVLLIGRTLPAKPAAFLDQPPAVKHFGPA